MPNKSLTTKRLTQGAFTPTNTDLIHVVQNGQSFVCMLDELSLLLQGATVEHSRQTAFRGALILANTAATPEDGAPVTFVSSVYDTDSFFSGGMPSRLTIPIGVTAVEITGAFETLATTARLDVIKNGATFDGAPFGAYSNGCISISSGIIPVSGGDYFEIISELIASYNTNSWLAIKVLEEQQ